MVGGLPEEVERAVLQVVEEGPLLRGERGERGRRRARPLGRGRAPRVGPERLLDLQLRTGPYGDQFGAREGGLTLAALEQAPHGIDFGPLKPRIPEVLRTESGMIELAPEPLVADVDRLREALTRDQDGGPVLVGRRHLRSNNSWMHNLPMLVRGPARCTLHVHPSDAQRYGLADGEPAVVRSRTGNVEAEVEVTDAVMPGVVSLPHGWGHDRPGTAIPWILKITPFKHQTDRDHLHEGLRKAGLPE